MLREDMLQIASELEDLHIRVRQCYRDQQAAKFQYPSLCNVHLDRDAVSFRMAAHAVGLGRDMSVEEVLTWSE